jgi:hypothetical protein
MRFITDGNETSRDACKVVKPLSFPRGYDFVLDFSRKAWHIRRQLAECRPVNEEPDAPLWLIYQRAERPERVVVPTTVRAGGRLHA